MRNSLIAAALCFLTALEGCGSSPSTAPTPTVQGATLSGTVVASASGAPLSGATVTVLDGANLGAASACDSAGRYQIPNLLAGTFTVQAASRGYEPVMKSATLVGSSGLDFALPNLPAPQLETVGTGTSGIRQPDGSYAVPIVAVNRGDGCAGDVRGTADFFSANGNVQIGLPFEWPPSTVLRPAAQFAFQVCCLGADVAFNLPTATVRYTYATVTCPPVAQLMK